MALLQRSFDFCGNRFVCTFMIDTNAKTSGWNECLAAGFLRRRICADADSVLSKGQERLRRRA